MYASPQDISEKLQKLTKWKIPLKLDDLVNKKEVIKFMGDDA